jgi:uncharacterized protein (TIGR00297 family)
VILHPGLLFLALGLNVAASVAALARRSLTRGGAAAAAVVGSGILYFGGLLTWGMLILFFVSSTAIGRIGSAAKSGLSDMHEKGGERDLVQVLANGGVGLVATLLYAAFRSPAFAAAAAGSLAAANADTWASELGVLSRRSPVSITTRQPVEVGASGGVTRMGTVASIGGSSLIALWFALWSWAAGGNATAIVAGAGALSGRTAGPSPPVLFVVVACAGALGSVVDSVFGATVQALYRTPAGGLTERRAGSSGTHTLVRGWTKITNDTVNVICTATGALAAGAMVALLAAF